MGSQIPKQYLPLQGRPLLEHTLACFLKRPDMAAVVLVLAAGDTRWRALAGSDSARLLRAPGGATRCESVYQGLLSLSGRAADEDWILVHDAARPCLRQGDIDRLLGALSPDSCGGLLAVAVQDTLKREDGRRFVSATVERRGLWRALTPQAFRLGPLRAALAAACAAACAGQQPVTDEAMAMERQGASPRLVPGQPDNIKVTCRQDLRLAERILEARQT